jgi:DNA-directed RNA polymerase II subunit RPB1
MNTRFTETDDIEVADVKGIQFSIMSADEIRTHSVVHVTCPDLYDKNVPKMNGLYDLRMGTTDKSMLCETCKSDIINCQGHFGHIELAFPVYNICYIKQVFKILQCVCMRCSNVLLTDDYKKMYTTLKKVRANLRFRRIYDLIKKQSPCPTCEFKQPKWTMDASRIDCSFGDEVSPDMNAKIALSILRKISDTDCVLMGFHPVYSHPKNMIFENLPVCPPVVRPSVMMDHSMRTQDDLTHKLIEIIKTNQLVDKYLKSHQPNILDEHIKLLQFHVSTLIDNDIPGQPQATQRTGRPIKSISQRIKSKEGRVRGNLMGKRVDFSARTVITAEPNIRLDQLGVPVSIARNLTYSERVTAYNKEFLQKCVDNGPEPKGISDVGARYVITHEQRQQQRQQQSRKEQRREQRKDLRFAKDIQLHEGDIVERHLMDGDYVVFNRQPTLHKMSMMGHRVKVMPGKTFRLNLSACSSYNADFDKVHCRKQEA